jgi:PAS domain-containing protein
MCHKGMPPEMLAPWAIAGRICRECLDRFGGRAGVPLLDFLDLLEVPVLVTDSDMVVTLANQPLLTLFGKHLSQVKGQRGGDVFECANARLPGGCGRTVQCSGCAIRRAVAETFATGKSLRNVPAYLNRDMATQFQQLGLVISTEKVWGVVLLRIDRIGSQQESGQQSQGH